MVRLLSTLLLLFFTLLAFAGVLAVLPLDWPVAARLVVGIVPALLIPAVLAFWLFTSLNQRQVNKTTIKWTLMAVVLVIQGVLVAFFVFALDRRPNDFLTGVVALFIEPKAELFAGERGSTKKTATDETETGGHSPDTESDPVGQKDAPSLAEPVPPPLSDQPRSTKLGLEAYHLWSKRLGSPGFDAAVDAAATPQGAVIVVGRVTPAAEPNRPAPEDNRQLSLTYLDSRGFVRWETSIKAGQVTATDVTTDSVGSLYLLGTLLGPVDFGRGAVKIETPQVFVVKYDDSGQYRWLQLFSVPEGAAQHLAVADNGEILVGGTFSTALKVGGRQLKSKGPANLFIVKLSPSGEPIWLRQLGESRQRVWAEAFGFYRDETVLIGQYIGGENTGKSALAPLGPDVPERGVFMLRLSQSGKSIATYRLQYGHDQQMGFSAVFDGAGNVVIARGFWGEVKGDGYAFKSRDALDVFVGKFDRDGQHRWSHSFGGTHDQAFPVVATDHNGRVFVAGTVSLGIDLGHGLLTARGTADVFLAVFSSGGEPKGSMLIANNHRGGARALAVDKAGKLIVCGTFTDTMELGGGPLHAARFETNPQPDIFVAKLSW